MMRRRLFLFPSLYLLLACAFPIALAAQATTGIIRGVVVDADGNPVTQATVTMVETRTNFQREVVTGANGGFTASLLPLGTYDVSARAVGLQEARHTGLVLRVGATVDLQMTLGRAVVLEPLIVQAVQPTVDPAQTEAATRLPAEATQGLPNNGRDFINLTTLTPNVAIVQGPDGDELTIAGQRGINNNIMVDGADFNNPFFGEQRGGQRPAFTFNLDAVEEIVVIANGANAEFGRSGGGFVNVITKSGTNELGGSAHYFGKFDQLSAEATHTCSKIGGACSSIGQAFSRDPSFSQHQFGFTLGGPIVRDKAFFFIALDVQEAEDTRQQNRASLIDSRILAWTDTAFGGAFAGEAGSIRRTDKARALLAKLDFRLGDRHNASLKYNFSWAEQENGTFDVDTWLRSANGLEKDFSHAINGSLVSVISPRVTNEFRFQYAREDRPRPYTGPTIPGLPALQAVIDNDGSVDGNRPLPDIGIPNAAGAVRLGMPFFLPVQAHDTRVQLVDNVSISAGDHLVKFGGEYNRTETVQTFIGFGNGRFIFNSIEGFLAYSEFGNSYVECPGDLPGAGGLTALDPEPCGPDPVSGFPIPPIGPIIFYNQQAGVPPFSLKDQGTQTIPQTEIAFFIQDTWKPHRNLTLNYGLRWEASIQPEVRTPPSDVFFAEFIGASVTTTEGAGDPVPALPGTHEFPSDGTIPDDWDNFQPRFGFAWDAQGNGKTVVRGSLGWYYARIAALNFASTRSTNGSIGQALFRAHSFLLPILGAPPDIDGLLASPAGGPFQPDIFVTHKDFENPRTIAATFEIEREIAEGVSASVNYTHSRTDGLARFINRNSSVFGRNGGFPGDGPWSAGLTVGGGVFGGLQGVNSGLITLESIGKSRFNGITLGLKRVTRPVLFQVNYTLSYDKSDDDNERDPFTFRYARPDSLEKDYNWSDRDQRHRFNAWLLAMLPADISINNRIRAASAQPVSASCGQNPFSATFVGPGGSGADTPPAGQRIANDIDRNCADGSVLRRNTLRKDNAFFQWDIRFSKLFRTRGGAAFEAIIDIFNVLDTSNFLDPTFGNLLQNFDGTVQSGLGTPRQVQVGARVIF